MTSSWRVHGGRPLSGVLEPSGSKNAALPILAAALLTDKEVVLENCPDILDVAAMIKLLENLGAVVETSADHSSVSITASAINPDRLDCGLARAIRASILLAGPVVEESFQP